MYLCYNVVVNEERQQAWNHYFQTGDREPIIKAYWKSISYIAHARYPAYEEDMFQVGLMGLLKAISRIDVNRVKSIDAWVWLNVRGEMFNVKLAKPTLPIVIESERFAIEEDKDPKIYMQQAFEVLNERDRYILDSIYYKNKTRQALGKELGITGMRVGQLEQRALKQLREVL